MSSFVIHLLRVRASARTAFPTFKHPLATVTKRLMSTKTIAVIDLADLQDGQMYVSSVIHYHCYLIVTVTQEGSLL
jgi:hypothetical protein